MEMKKYKKRRRKTKECRQERFERFNGEKEYDIGNISQIQLMISG